MNTLSSNLQSLLDNRLRYLPPITGAAIQSIDWSALVIEIGRKYGLHIDEMEDFQAVVLKAMIGLISPQNFENELIATLALSPANADKVIADINVKIFGPIHDYVMRQGKPVDGLSASGIVIENSYASSNIPVASNNFGKPVDIDFGGTAKPMVTPVPMDRPVVATPITPAPPTPTADLSQEPLPKKDIFRQLALLRAHRNHGNNGPVV